MLSAPVSALASPLPRAAFHLLACPCDLFRILPHLFSILPHPLDCITCPFSGHYVMDPDSPVLGMTCSVIETHDYLQSLTLPQPLQGSDTEALEMAWASRNKPVLPPIEWQMAVAMSLHPRLGGDSHLHRLESLMVRFAVSVSVFRAHLCFTMCNRPKPGCGGKRSNLPLFFCCADQGHCREDVVSVRAAAYSGWTGS